MEVSGLERAGEFGLAELQRAWLRKARCSGTRRNYSWFEKICAQV
jgi:hypothetical protein